jgi:hypothetical protein
MADKPLNQSIQGKHKIGLHTVSHFGKLTLKINGYIEIPARK